MACGVHCLLRQSGPRQPSWGSEPCLVSDEYNAIVVGSGAQPEVTLDELRVAIREQLCSDAAHDNSGGASAEQCRSAPGRE